MEKTDPILLRDPRTVDDRHIVRAILGQARALGFALALIAEFTADPNETHEAARLLQKVREADGR